jgi:VWFA-related protein
MRFGSLPLASILFATGVFVCASSALQAQAPPSTDTPPESTAPDTTQQDQQLPTTTLKVNVNLVSNYFSVRDKHNGLISTLTKNDCTISEDGVPQTIKNWGAETDQALTLGILLDTSGSQQQVLPLEQQTGGEFLKRILRAKDEAFLVSFDVDVNLLQDFTSSASQLSRAMDKAQINVGSGGAGVPGIGQGPVPVHGAPRGTLLYDAVVLAANEKMRTENERKAMILLTDGGDQGSHYKLQDAVAAAQKANSIIYVLLIADRGFYGGFGMGYTGASDMKRLAEQTGGRMIDVGNNGPKMEAAFKQIEDELRTQYVAT